MKIPAQARARALALATLPLIALALASCSGKIIDAPSSPDAAVATGPDATTPTDGGTAPTGCAARALAVREALPASAADNPLDPLGYMPFAEDGCGLVYVSGQDRRLYRLAFDTGERVELESLSRPTRPSARDGLVAWEAVDAAGRGVVRVRVGGGEPITIPGAYTRAFEPRVGVDAVVYTFTRDDPERDDADLDVAVFTPSTRTVAVVGGGPGQQRFGALGRGRVAYTDFAEDPTGVFSRTEPRAADVVVVDLATGERTVRSAPGKQAFPLIDDDGLLLYTDFGAVHPEPKFGTYSIKVGRFNAPVASDRVVHERPTIGSATPWIQPALGQGFVSWVEDDARLFVRATSLESPPTLLSTRASGFVGVVHGGLAAYVAARSETSRGQVFVESRALR